MLSRQRHQDHKEHHKEMARNLPPLNPLKAFEVAARHLSFTKAADELFVTPSAVSHQVKTLEEHLNIVLFVREAKGLMLTAAGRAYLPAVQQAFQVLTDATRQLNAELAPVLRVDIPPTFAAKWLIPRLDRFVRAHPEIDIRVSTNSGTPDFTRDDYDVAIRFGRGRYPDLHSELCLSVNVFPVCSPALLQGPNAIREPSDLRQHTLLHDASTYSDGHNPAWADWLAYVGVTDVDASRGLSFTPSHLVIGAAIDGLGVALVKDTWVEQDLLAGRLVRPFGVAMPVESAYYMVFPLHRANDVRIATFVDWVRSEGAARPPA
jgi:LysR family glycine cleavage system transcriptional activator